MPTPSETGPEGKNVNSGMTGKVIRFRNVQAMEGGPRRTSAWRMRRWTTRGAGAVGK
jgi:hypothetical protein